MEFINSCNCIVDYNILEKAIIAECDRRCIKPKHSYKIYDYRGYAGISLKHDKVSVHRIIGKYMVGFDFDSSISVHHLDGNKLNNSVSNLQVIRNDLHIREHDIHKYVPENHKRSFGERMKPVVSRTDVTRENVAELIEMGLTTPEIAKRLNCGTSTVKRRLGVKDY